MDSFYKKIEEKRKISSRGDSKSSISLSDILHDAFEDTRFKGKQLNCGRVNNKSKTDILEDTEYYKKLKKKRQASKKFEEKSIELKKQAPKAFVCGKYKDEHAYPKSSLNKKKTRRVKSANDIYNDLKLSLNKKDTIKPFICGKAPPQGKIEYFSPVSISSSRDLKNSQNLSNRQLVEALYLDSSKTTRSDKPLKFGKYKDETVRSLYAEPKNIQVSKELLIKKERKQVPMKFGKVLPQKPPAYFSPVQRKTLSELKKDLSRNHSSIL